MKRLSRLTLVICALTYLPTFCRAQEIASIGTLKEQIQKLEKIERDMTLSEEVRTLNHTFLEERRTELRRLLQKRIEFLRQYQIAAESVLTPKEKKVIDDSIQSISIELKNLDSRVENKYVLARATAPSSNNVSKTESAITSANTSPGEKPASQTSTQAAASANDSEDDRGVLERLADRGFSLQRAVTGDNATEGASFSFLRTFRKKTVFATDFAFIWNPPHTLSFNDTSVEPEFSVEGHLTSDESTSEDAWRFRGRAQFRTTFQTRTLSGIRNYVGGKLESDQKFNTKKLMFEYVTTPTAIKIGIGRYLANDRKKYPVSFRWRPYFGLDAGHTFKRGSAELPENTILRLVPRLRAEFRLNFIDWALKSHRTLLYADNSFYYLPLESGARTPNFLVSGLEIGFNKNVGLGFKYKNGKEAPKFQRVHSFGGEFTFRFGKNAQ